MPVHRYALARYFKFQPTLARTSARYAINVPNIQSALAENVLRVRDNRTVTNCVDEQA